jgi:hypothetical protein
MTPVTRTPQPAAVAETPIPFAQTVVELRYTIPALGLDRRLQGNVASQLILVDETTGLALERNNQAGILLELQQALPQTELAPLPDGCDLCVHFEYELPLEDESESGWLQDPVLLASVENFMSVVLGPHFPPGTILGLRRSASPYDPAHSIALTGDGRLWTWLATEGQLREPATSEALEAAVQASFPPLATTPPDERYAVECAGVPVETLFLSLNGESQQVRIICPAFSLPSTLLPLYLQLDGLLAQKLAGLAGPERPKPAFPLAALLSYKRVDGTHLTLYQDGQAIATDAAQSVYTSTLTANQIISLTTPLLESNTLQPGLNTFRTTNTVDDPAVVALTSQEPTSILVVRGPNGVYDAKWPGTPEPLLADLNTFLDALIGIATPETTQTPEPAVTATTQSSTMPTLAATPTPTATP